MCVHLLVIVCCPIMAVGGCHRLVLDGIGQIDDFDRGWDVRFHALEEGGLPFHSRSDLEEYLRSVQISYVAWGAIRGVGIEAFPDHGCHGIIVSGDGFHEGLLPWHGDRDFLFAIFALHQCKCHRGSGAYQSHGDDGCDRYLIHEF